MGLVTAGGMNPSQVREYVGHQHIQLRILFVEVRRALAEDRDPRPAILKLVYEVREHLDLEDRLLVPALRAIDRWGPQRASEVAAEHARQREELTALRERLRSSERSQAVEAAASLLAELTADMDAEERDLLSPELLRDDLITIGQNGG